MSNKIAMFYVIPTQTETFNLLDNSQKIILENVSLKTIEFEIDKIVSESDHFENYSIYV